MRPRAELGGRLPTPVVSPACPCPYPRSYPCSCSWLSCLNAVINGYGMPGLYGRWWAGSARPQAWGTQIVRTLAAHACHRRGNHGAVARRLRCLPVASMPLPFACPCLLCPYSCLSLRIVVTVLTCGACHVYGPVHMVHTGERHRRQGVNETVMPGMWSVQAGGLRLSRLGRVCRFCTPLSHAA